MSSGEIYLQSNLNRITVETAQQCRFFVCTIERSVVAQRRRGEFTMRGTSHQAPSASTLPLFCEQYHRTTCLLATPIA